jgi:hypothetical protein
MRCANGRCPRVRDTRGDQRAWKRMGVRGERTVDFSTTILEDLDTDAIMRAAPSQYDRSAALPAPTPAVFVGLQADS